jgi:hypothetical protein
MPMGATQEIRRQAQSSTDPEGSQAGMRSAFSRAMRHVHQPSFSCLVLASCAVLAVGCHNGSGSSTPKPGADAGAGAADAAVGPDSSTARASDAVASLDTGVPSTVDAAAGADTRVPSAVDAVASADQGVPVTADGSAQDVRQGDAILNRDVSPAADASKDTPASGEWLDDAGVCRSNQIPTYGRSCRKTFQEAVSAGALVGEVKSGWCGDMLVWILWTTPTLGCGYDSTGSTLVAQFLGDDVRSFCGRASYSVSTPNWPSNCVPKAVDAGPAAP